MIFAASSICKKVSIAFEKTGRDKDTLQFYEKVINNIEFNQPIKDRARIRWIKVKLRQSSREKSSSKSGMVARGRDHQAEAKKYIDYLKVDIKKEPKYPNIRIYKNTPDWETDKASLKTASNTSAKPASNTIQEKNKIKQYNLGDLLITVNNKTSRINIENGKDGTTASVFVEKADCKSMDVEIEILDDAFKIEDWKIVIKISNDGKIDFLQMNGKDHLRIDINS